MSAATALQHESYGDQHAVVDGARIANLRRERDIAQARLGELVGISQQHVSKIERGDLNPRVDTLVRLARALGVGLEEVVRRDGWTDYEAVPFWGSVPVDAGRFGFEGGSVRVLSSGLARVRQPRAVRNAQPVVGQRGECLVYPGEYVVVDPERTWTDQAVHLLQDGDRVVLKQVWVVKPARGEPELHWQDGERYVRRRACDVRLVGVAVAVQPPARTLPVT